MKQNLKSTFRKGAALLIAVAMLVTLLAGCGNKKNDDPKGGKTEDKVSLRFFWWGNDDRHAATQSMIDAFEKSHTNIKISGEPNGFGDFETKIQTALSGGQEADIMQGDPAWLLKFSAGFADLSNVSQLDLSGYDADLLKSGQYDGKQIGIPYGKQVLALSLNKSAYERYGVTELPKTWEEFKEAAKKFPEGSYPLVSPTPSFVIMYYLQQKTGKAEFDEKGAMNWTESDYVDAFKWYQEMVDAKVLCSRQDYLQNVGTEPVSLAQIQKFIDGQYAGVMEWSSGATALKSTLDEKGDTLVIQQVPKLTDAKENNTLGKLTFMFFIKKGEKNMEQAATFLNEFINGKESNEILGTTRGIPANKNALKVLEDSGKLEGIAKDISAVNTEAKPLVFRNFDSDATLMEIGSRQLESMQLGKSTPEAAAKAYFDEIKTQAAALVVSYGVK